MKKYRKMFPVTNQVEYTYRELLNYMFEEAKERGVLCNESSSQFCKRMGIIEINLTKFQLFFKDLSVENYDTQFDSFLNKINELTEQIKTKQLKLTSNQNKLKVLRSMGSLIMRLDRLNNKINEL
jgi:hypothetical protein